MDLHQALATLLGDHVDAGPDVLDSLRILETAQGDASQQFAVQRQLEEMRVLVGHADQAAPAGSKDSADTLDSAPSTRASISTR